MSCGSLLPLAGNEAVEDATNTVDGPSQCDQAKEQCPQHEYKVEKRNTECIQNSLIAERVTLAECVLPEEEVPQQIPATNAHDGAGYPNDQQVAFERELSQLSIVIHRDSPSHFWFLLV